MRPSWTGRNRDDADRRPARPGSRRPWQSSSYGHDASASPRSAMRGPTRPEDTTSSHRHVSEVPQPLAAVNVSALLAGGGLELGHQVGGHPAAVFYLDALLPAPPAGPAVKGYGDCRGLAGPVNPGRGTTRRRPAVFGRRHGPGGGLGRALHAGGPSVREGARSGRSARPSSAGRQRGDGPVRRARSLGHLRGLRRTAALAPPSPAR
jgi:hypothetical protein